MDAASRVTSLTSHSAHEVAAVRTPVAQAQLRAAIGRAYQRQTGTPPSAALLDTLTAQASVETGHGAKMYNFNFGGIKGASPGGDTANYLTREVVADRSVTVHQNFRAYTSLDEGADDYVRLLSGRFGGALSRAQVGDVDGFAHALKQSGYYTAPEADYASALRSAGGGSNAVEVLLPVPTAIEIGQNAAYTSSADLSRVLDALSGSALRVIGPKDGDE
jgi:hypothetical protein